MKNLLGIIPARFGSKGIPKKNLKKLGGKPLIYYSINVAKSLNIFNQIILSTNSKKIAQVGKKFGLDIPFMRPNYLAQDATPMLPVLRYTLNKFSQLFYMPDIVCILQPTSPFRKPKDIIKGYELIKNTNCDSVVSVKKVPDHYSPEFLMKIQNKKLDFFLPSGKKIIRRQDAKQAYSRNGDFYFIKSSVIIDQNSLYGEDCRPIIINSKDGVNLDTNEDWEKAESIIKRGES